MTIESPEEHRAWIYLGVTEGAATPIFLVNPGREHMLKPGTTELKMQIPAVPLPAGRYYLWGGIYKNWTNGVPLIDWQPLTRFDVYGPELDAAPKAVVRLSPLHVSLRVGLRRALTARLTRLQAWLSPGNGDPVGRPRRLALDG